MKKHSKPIDTIVIHHSATRVLPLREALEAFRKDHKARGWDDIGYHYLVHPDPKQGWCVARDPKYRGAHVMGMNNGKIGVCLIGDYSDMVLDEACGYQVTSPKPLPFWFWGALMEIRDDLSDVVLGGWGFSGRFATHSELLPGHTDCGKGVIQRFVNELNEYYG